MPGSFRCLQDRRSPPLRGRRPLPGEVVWRCYGGGVELPCGYCERSLEAEALVAIVGPGRVKLACPLCAAQLASPAATTGCRVYWGSHGCKLERGHDGPHLCSCTDDPGIDPETKEYIDDPGCFNVGAPPYYGPETRFYGEDATGQEQGMVLP